MLPLTIMRKCKITTCYERNCIQDKCWQRKYHFSNISYKSNVSMRRWIRIDYILIGITNLKYFEICNRHNVYSVPQKNNRNFERSRWYTKSTYIIVNQPLLLVLQLFLYAHFCCVFISHYHTRQNNTNNKNI